MLITLALFFVNANAQVENCMPYGDFPTDLKGQRCWLNNYLSSTIWKYNNKQRVDTNYYFSISRTELDSFYFYTRGLNTYYLDKNNMSWGSYWYPCASGGIAQRYRVRQYPTSTGLNWNYIRTLDSAGLYNLSPAEKFGNRNFEVTDFELKHRGPERGTTADNGFCGYCNGSRLAGALVPEPKYNVTVSSKADPSIKITFSPSDIKAIVAASYMHSRFYFGAGSPDVAGGIDPNPAIVDIILRVYLANHRMPFFVDADPGRAIYNETVVGYDRKVSVPVAASASEIAENPGATRKVKVSLVLYLQDEVTIDDSNVPTIPIMADKAKALVTPSGAATFGFWVHKGSYTYDLFTDNSGKIINGKWTSPAIDFLWASNGMGNDEFSENYRPPGNKELKFRPILQLVRLSIRAPDSGEEATVQSFLPLKIESSTNTDRRFQTPPEFLHVSQNTENEKNK